MAVIYHKTPLGFARIEATDDCVLSLTVHDNAADDADANGNAIANMAASQLDEYFAGTRRQFDFPYHQPGSEFQQKVWHELKKINYGETITYKQQSKRMNDPLAIRAIAATNGKNSMWIVVPCHRVIGSDGKLTGYAGGLWRKQWLLQHEAKTIGVGQTSLFF